MPRIIVPLTSASFMSLGGCMFKHFVDAGNGTTVETDLYTDSVLANTLASNGDSIEAIYDGIYFGSTSSKQIQLYFDGVVVYDSTALAVATSVKGWRIHAHLVRVSATVVRVGVVHTGQGFATQRVGYTEATGLTLTNANTLKITGTASAAGAATNDIVAKTAVVRFLPGV